jgi:hypothetical protein
LDFSAFLPLLFVGHVKTLFKNFLISRNPLFIHYAVTFCWCILNCT